MPLHLDEFSREAFQGYIENVPAKRAFPLQKFMPKDTVYDVDFAYNVVNGTYTQMASLTAFDAGAPLRDKDVIARMTGELAKIQHGYRLTEKELLQYNRPRMDAEQQKVVDTIYGQADKLAYGLDDREEWLRAQAIYTGQINYEKDDIKIAVDYDIPGSQKQTAGAAWAANGTTGDPVADLLAARQLFNDANNGAEPEEMHFDAATEQKLLKSQAIKANIFGNGTDPRIVTPAMLQAYFTSLGLPNYVVVKDKVVDDSGAIALMPQNKVVFLGGQIGRLLIGPTVESNYEPKRYVVPVIQETNPPKQEFYVGETAFPAIERLSGIVYLVSI